MNYERLSKLAELLNDQHGRQNEYGFIVAPHSELQLNEHRNALAHSDRIFNYQPMADEKLAICSVTRTESVNEEAHVKINYSHVHLEQMGYESLATPEIAPLLNEYMEFTRSRV